MSAEVVMSMRSSRRWEVVSSTSSALSENRRSRGLGIDGPSRTVSSVSLCRSGLL